MSDIEIMEFPYGAFLKVRLEFVLLRDNELEARIMRIIEGWMIDQKKAWMNECAQAASDGKPEPTEPDYYVTLSYAQIITQLYMFNSSRKGEGKGVIEGKKNSMSRNTLARAIASLLADEYIIVRPNPDKIKEYDAAQYTLNIPLIQEHMKLLPNSPMTYLGSNGHKDSKTRHGDAQKTSIPPRTKNEHPTQEKSASPSPKNVHGDAQKFHTLIDISNRDTNRKKESTSAEQIETDSLSHPSLPSSISSVSNGSIPSSSSQEKESPSAPSLSQRDGYNTPTPVDNTQLPIATVTTRNTSNERNTEPLLSEARRVFNLLCEAFFAIAPEFTSKIEKQCADLAPHVVSIEDLKSLKVYARAKIKDDPKIPDKQVYLGNLVKCVDGWKQEREPLPEKPKSQTSKPPIRNGAAAYDAMVAEVQARIAAKAGVNK